MTRRGQTIGVLGLTCLVLVGLCGFALDWLDRAFPPPIDMAGPNSAEMQDADGQLLRAFTTPEGRWRLKTSASDVDPLLIRMVIAYEDRRFYQHSGLDPLAIGRAAFQLIRHGRIVSGASTLSMQVARLIEPRKARSFPVKLLQMARAVQIERRLSKAQILDLYLTHAPYGGNLEGVRAASLAYFNKEPKHLTPAEAALLVALPQLPERRRPDRFSDNALHARERVLARMQTAGIVSPMDAELANAAHLPKHRLELPLLAANLADAKRRRRPESPLYPTTLRKNIQVAMEAVARQAAQRLPPKVSVAIMVADSQTGDILAHVGSASYLDASRSGWIDMTRMERSPGSTLKPLIYGLAFEQGLVAQETMIEDRPADFFGYRPKNFDMSYQGDVTVRSALQLSLNVPAVRLLNAVGPSQMLSRLRKANIKIELPSQDAPGLALALGGAGTTLRDLMGLYTALARQGSGLRLKDCIAAHNEQTQPEPLLDQAAAWSVTDILSGVAPPLGNPTGRIAYKTGTSYGYRDGWSIGYDGRTVIGVWVGRPDNSAIPGLTGYGTAAPILFEAFARSGLAPVPLPAPPAGATHPKQADLPTGLKRFSREANGLIAIKSGEKAPVIIYPPEGAQVELGKGPDGQSLPLALKLQAGRAPFRWLANGQPLPDIVRTRTTTWVPQGSGYSTLTVIDAIGRTASVGVFLH
ncbi:penicillin-binding protein 1C [Agrobacterium vitis]|nr:penicillin-binding protein 1C [Agrobacterium vitis]MBE1440051.1 penicillin-binding protein 1C [Agrobacterium vitis]